MKPPVALLQVRKQDGLWASTTAIKTGAGHLAPSETLTPHKAPQGNVRLPHAIPPWAATAAFCNSRLYNITCSDQGQRNLCNKLHGYRALADGSSRQPSNNTALASTCASSATILSRSSSRLRHSSVARPVAADTAACMQQQLGRVRHTPGSAVPCTTTAPPTSCRKHYRTALLFKNLAQAKATYEEAPPLCFCALPG